MHDIQIVIIWFWSVSAGVLLTLLMPHLVSAPRRRNHLHDAEIVRLAQDTSDELMPVLVQTNNEPTLTCVSTAWAWGIPRATPDQRARDQDQAA